MKTKRHNNCYTYFSIVGDFDPQEISNKLGLEPFKFWKAGDLRRAGEPFGFARWSFGKCEEYDVDVNNQIKKTIAPLLDKVDILNSIRKNFNVDFSIVIVPEIYAGEITPILSPNLDIIDFCHDTRTQIDIDLYVLK